MAWLSCIDRQTAADGAEVRRARQDLRPRRAAGGAPGQTLSRGGVTA